MRDLLAYLPADQELPSDNVACARVLAAPYWGAEPRDLVRLAERADRNHRRPIWEELESAAGCGDSGAVQRNAAAGTRKPGWPELVQNWSTDCATTAKRQ